MSAPGGASVPPTPPDLGTDDSAPPFSESSVGGSSTASRLSVRQSVWAEQVARVPLEHRMELRRIFQYYDINHSATLEINEVRLAPFVWR